MYGDSKECSACNGHGKVETTVEEYNEYGDSKECSACNGHGKVETTVEEYNELKE